MKKVCGVSVKQAAPAVGAAILVLMLAVGTAAAQTPTPVTPAPGGQGTQQGQNQVAQGVNILTQPLQQMVPIYVDLNNNGVNEDPAEFIGIMDVYGAGQTITFTWGAAAGTGGAGAGVTGSGSTIRVTVTPEGTSTNQPGGTTGNNQQNGDGGGSQQDGNGGFFDNLFGTQTPDTGNNQGGDNNNNNDGGNNGNNSANYTVGEVGQAGGTATPVPGGQQGQTGQQAQTTNNLSYRVSLRQYATGVKLADITQQTPYTELQVSHHWASAVSGTSFTMGPFGFAGQPVCYTCVSYFVVQPETYQVNYNPATGVTEYIYTPLYGAVGQQGQTGQQGQQGAQPGATQQGQGGQGGDDMMDNGSGTGNNNNSFAQLTAVQGQWLSQPFVFSYQNRDARGAPDNDDDGDDDGTDTGLVDGTDGTDGTDGADGTVIN